MIEDDLKKAILNGHITAVENVGNKITNIDSIKKLVDATPEALELYRY